MQFVNKRVDL